MARTVLEQEDIQVVAAARTLGVASRLEALGAVGSICDAALAVAHALAEGILHVEGNIYVAGAEVGSSLRGVQRILALVSEGSIPVLERGLEQGLEQALVRVRVRVRVRVLVLVLAQALAQGQTQAHAQALPQAHAQVLARAHAVVPASGDRRHHRHRQSQSLLSGTTSCRFLTPPGSPSRRLLGGGRSHPPAVPDAQGARQRSAGQTGLWTAGTRRCPWPPVAVYQSSELMSVSCL